MSGRGRKDEKEGEGSGSGGGWKTFWKIAGAAAATAVVAGAGLYIVLKQPEAEQVAVEAGGSSGVQTKEITVWTKPNVGWFKLNVDGSLLRQIGSAGCGGVLRDDSGKWVNGFAQNLEYSSTLKEDETEREGILRGMKWAKEKLGVWKVEVESDNEGIVIKVTNGSKSDDPRIHEIRELLVPSHDWEATLRWIPKPANGVAHELADIASKNLTSKEFDLYDPPGTWMKALAKDSPHLY